MTTPRPWFRVYREILADRKVARIAKATGQPRVVVIGLWTTLLALACGSPQPGRLLLADDLPITLDDLTDETGLPHDLLTTLLDQLAALHMITHDGDIAITHWQSRQFESDTNATARWRRWRDRQSPTPDPLTSGATHASDHEHTANVCQTVAQTATNVCANATPALASFVTNAPPTPPDSESESQIDTDAHADTHTDTHAHATTCPPPDLSDHDLLVGIGITEPALSRLLARPMPAGLVRAWVDYACSQPNLRNPAGYILTRLALGKPPPPITGRAGTPARPPPAQRWYTDDEYQRYFLQPDVGKEN